MDVQATTDMPGWKLININEHTIIQTIDSYNKILCSLLINETVEVIALIGNQKSAQGKVSESIHWWRLMVVNWVVYWFNPIAGSKRRKREWAPAQYGHYSRSNLLQPGIELKIAARGLLGAYRGDGYVLMMIRRDVRLFNVPPKADW